MLCFRAWRTKESANYIQKALTLVPSLALKGGSIEASTHQVDINVTGEIKASKDPVLETTELQSNTAGSVNPVPKKNSSCDITVQVAGDAAAPSSVDLNADAPRDVTGSLYPFDDLMSSIWTTNKYLEHEKEAGSSNLEGKSDAATVPVFYWLSVLLAPSQWQIQYLACHAKQQVMGYTNL